MTDRPVPFEGSQDEQRSNFETHHWVQLDDEIKCFDCDAKLWHTAAKYRCGVRVPREVIPRIDN